MPGFWETFKTVDGRVSLAKKWVPGPVMTFATTYATYLWAKVSHLQRVEQFVLALCVVAACLTIWICVVVLLPYLRTPKVKGILTPVNMNSSDARITFTNKGKRAEFFVKCECVGQTNTNNPLPTITYDLAWANQTTKILSVAEGDSAHLVLATWKIETFPPIKTLEGAQITHRRGIAEMRALGIEQPIHSLLWLYGDKELPTCDIKMTVISDGGRGRLEHFFTLTPAHFAGPLKITEYSPVDLSRKQVA